VTKRKPTKRTDVAVLPAQGPTVLLAAVRELIVQARKGVARAVDSGLTTLYWHVGRRVRQDILKEKRAEYGEEIVAALRRQFGWTHFKAIIPMADPLKGNFYAEMCRIERWKTRTLEKKIGSMLFERTALSRLPLRPGRGRIGASNPAAAADRLRRRPIDARRAAGKEGV